MSDFLPIGVFLLVWFFGVFGVWFFTKCCMFLGVFFHLYDFSLVCFFWCVWCLIFCQMLYVSWCIFQLSNFCKRFFGVFGVWFFFFFVFLGVFFFVKCCMFFWCLASSDLCDFKIRVDALRVLARLHCFQSLCCIYICGRVEYLKILGVFGV